MLMCIPAVLDGTELKKVRAANAEGGFEDDARRPVAQGSAAAI